jgi:hypothetical protein
MRPTRVGLSWSTCMALNNSGYTSGSSTISLSACAVRWWVSVVTEPSSLRPKTRIPNSAPSQAVRDSSRALTLPLQLPRALTLPLHLPQALSHPTPTPTPGSLSPYPYTYPRLSLTLPLHLPQALTLHLPQALSHPTPTPGSHPTPTPGSLSPARVRRGPPGPGSPRACLPPPPPPPRVAPGWWAPERPGPAACACSTNSTGTSFRRVSTGKRVQ